MKLPIARRPGRGATTALEFVFAGPVFLFMVLGAIEVGRGIMVTNQLTTAARDGCRMGVLESKGDSDVTSAVTNTLTALGLTTTNVHTTIKVNGSVASLSTASAGDVITVSVTIPTTDVSWLPVAHYLHGNLGGQWTLRRE